MKYEEDSEDIEFPPCKIDKYEGPGLGPGPKSYFGKCSKYKIIAIISAIVILALILFLIIFLKRKKPVPKDEPQPPIPPIIEDGGYLIASYLIESNENITIINIPEKLTEKDYSINQIINDNRVRNLGEINGNNHKYSIKPDKTNILVEYKIKFNKILSNMSGIFKECENLINVDFTYCNSSKIENITFTIIVSHVLKTGDAGIKL